MLTGGNGEEDNWEERERDMQEAKYILLATQQKCIGSVVRVRGEVKGVTGDSRGNRACMKRQKAE